MLSAVPLESNASTRVSRVRPLLEMAVRGLEPMLDHERNLFTYRLKLTPEGLLKKGTSLRYTIIALLGIRRASQIGIRPCFDAHNVFDGLIRETRWVDNAGDWGLLLWLSALQSPGELSQLVVRAGLGTLLDRFQDTRERRTMEMAWVLAGLAHLRMVDTPGLPDVSGLAFRIYHRIIQNQGADGIFGHQAKSLSYAGKLRGRLGSFADQVYPIYALSKFGQAWGMAGAICCALRCADTLCRLQGPLGQWWWHYDSASGRVVGKYPVYSVHQDGMGPMALFALSEASGVDYTGPVYKGLEWIYGANELGIDMRNFFTSMIWRCIRQSSLRRLSSELLSLAGMPPLPGGLKVLHECRPYHLGWLLYAFSLKDLRCGE